MSTPKLPKCTHAQDRLPIGQLTCHHIPAFPACPACPTRVGARVGASVQRAFVGDTCGMLCGCLEKVVSRAVLVGVS